MTKNMLTLNILNQLWVYGIYETKRYRYKMETRDGRMLVLRIDRDMLDTTAALDKDNWKIVGDVTEHHPR